VVVNGGFETGSLAGWSAYGPHPPAVVRSPVHSGSFGAVIGSGIPLQSDSYITQTVAIPASATMLSFWYLPHCPDGPKFDQLQAQVFSPSSGLLLASALNTCSNTNAWTPATLNVSSLAGQTVVLYFNVHDDGFPTDPSYMFVDDIAIT
jgi:hypothetical protein